jgi:hypothetical protein
MGLWLFIGILLVGAVLVVFGMTAITGKGNGKARAAIGAGALAVSAAGFTAKKDCPEPPVPTPTPAPEPSPTPNPSPTPTPYPYPIPTPTPQPATPFEVQAAGLFDGTAAEAQIISALALQMADSLVWDGQRAKPVVTTTSDMGRVWADLQRYRGLSEQPWGTRFAALKQFLSSEMQTRGIINPAQAQAIDAARRAAAAQFYRDLGTALAKKSAALGADRSQW